MEGEIEGEYVGIRDGSKEIFLFYNHATFEQIEFKPITSRNLKETHLQTTLSQTKLN
jgi:hypothetical protein